MRVSLPAVFLVLGVALSCSTACVTAALVGEAHNAIASRRAAEVSDLENAAIAQALRSHLPPAAAGVSDADRVRVTASWRFHRAEADGDFSSQAIADSAAAARQLYGRAIPFVTRLELAFYRDTGRTKTLIEQVEIDPLKETADQLRAHLPPPGSTKTTRAQGLLFFPDLDGQTIHFTAVGDFTTETARAFVDFVGQLQAGTPGAPRFMLEMYRDTDVGSRSSLVGRFDSMSPKDRTP
jgi:hypothetical protein